MDRALAGSSCPFQTYEDSLVAFARALYAVRLDGGTCIEPGIPKGCGFHDPYEQYQEPPAHTIIYAGMDQEYRDGIGSSYGIDLIDVRLDPASDGQPLTLEFHGAPEAGATFGVQVLQLVDAGDGTGPRRTVTESDTTEVLLRVEPNGCAVHRVPAIDTTDFNRLGLIVTRLDAHEASDPTGAYTLTLHPGAGA
jgi:hypothetical protein